MRTASSCLRRTSRAMTPAYVGTVERMTNRTYRVTEIVGTSPDGIDEAIRNGIERASRTLRHLDWFEVTQVRGQVKDGAGRALPGRHQGRLPARGRLGRLSAPPRLGFTLTDQ